MDVPTTARPEGLVGDAMDAVLRRVDGALASRCDRSAILAALAEVGATGEEALQALAKHSPDHLRGALAPVAPAAFAALLIGDFATPDNSMAAALAAAAQAAAEESAAEEAVAAEVVAGAVAGAVGGCELRRLEPDGGAGL